MSAPESGLMRQRMWPTLRGRLLHGWFLLRRPMTFGVRGVVHDKAAGTVFLIRHTYVPGWQLPGGGVEPGETAAEALSRELAEEGNIQIRAAPELRSIHFNRQSSRRDHVALYLVSDFLHTARKIPDAEIAEAGFFRLDDLPSETTPATRLRLSEIFWGVRPSPYW